MAAPMRITILSRNRSDVYCTALKQAIACRLITNQNTIPKKKNKFIDSLRIYVRGGGGGQGFPRYGGIGGKGGDVVVTATKKLTLSDVRNNNIKKRFLAQNGLNSRKFRLLGEPGEDLNIPVPVGVVLRTDEGRQLGDLNKDGQQVIVARGGKGGNPENGFLGQRGDSKEITLDLKLIADIGLVGFPNAGKSTFLSAISRAMPKIAEYPFTTIRPQIGIIQYPDFRKISVADLPGLIEGAHNNYGMGHKFLKHVERTKMLIIIVDINGFSLGVKHVHRSAFENILLLNKELELYLPELVDRPAILVLNKIDTDNQSGDTVKQILQQVQNSPDSLNEVDKYMHPTTLMKFDGIFTISAKEKQGLDKVLHAVRQKLDHYAELKRPEIETEVEHVHYETLTKTLI
ncbi:hypothetical protein SNE40_022739 [Patella caerulea]|uniref:Uncharacterized protein n=1 Tax=Patella caerulea TaxID=87958 RepID=A0AAN8IZV6_PATCE